MAIKKVRKEQKSILIDLYFVAKISKVRRIEVFKKM